MPDLFGLSHPWFRPTWRRLAVVVACFGWSAGEFWVGSSTFGSLTLFIGTYAALFWMRMKDE